MRLKKKWKDSKKKRKARKSLKKNFSNLLKRGIFRSCHIFFAVRFFLFETVLWQYYDTAAGPKPTGSIITKTHDSQQPQPKLRNLVDFDV